MINHSYTLLLDMPLLHMLYLKHHWRHAMKLLVSLSSSANILGHLSLKFVLIRYTKLWICISNLLQENRSTQVYAANNSCIIIFSRLIYDAKNPNGSNRVPILLRTILLVMFPFFSLFDSVNVNWSFCGNHCTPRVLTSGKCFSNIYTPSALPLHDICSKTFVELEIHFLACIPDIFLNLDKSA